jgi:hypothetical protein
MRRIRSSFANSSCMLARLGRPGLPRSFKSAAGALPGTSSATERSPSPSAEPSNSVKMLAHRRRQPPVDIGVKAFLMRTKRCARNALHAFDSRRFNRQFTASRFQSFDHRLNLAAGLSGRVISKPFAQRVRVGNGCFPEAESNANLGTHTFGRTTYQECLTIHRSPHVELLAQCRDSLADRLRTHVVGTGRDHGRRPIGWRSRAAFCRALTSPGHDRQAPRSTDRRRCRLRPSCRYVSGPG